MSPLIPVLLIAAMTGAQAEANRIVLRSSAEDGRACYRYAMRGAASDKAVITCTNAIEDASIARDRTASIANRAVVYYHAARYGEALTDFTEVIESSPAHARNFVNRGLVFEQLSTSNPSYEEEAKADYRKALELSPTNPTAHRRLKELDKPRLERTRLRQRSIT